MNICIYIYIVNITHFHHTPKLYPFILEVFDVLSLLFLFLWNFLIRFLLISTSRASCKYSRSFKSNLLTISIADFLFGGLSLNLYIGLEKFILKEVLKIFYLLFIIIISFKIFNPSFIPKIPLNWALNKY